MNAIVQKVIDWLEAGAPHVDTVAGYNQADWKDKTDCGTVHCLGGAIIQFSGESFYNYDAESLSDQICRLANWHGAKAHAAKYDLFAACPLPRGAPTPQHAARVLRKFEETGEVDWLETKE